MKITVKKAVSDLEKIVPSLNDIRPFQLLKEMAGTVAIGTQGIEVDGLMKDYEAHIKEALDKNSPSELDIDPDTHPSYIRDLSLETLKKEDALKSKPEEYKEQYRQQPKPDKLVAALRKKLQEK